jgi:hypothetical protein
MAFNYSPKIVTDGLVLCLDAANLNSYVSGSTIWRDISRGGNNGTLINGPTFNSANGGSIVFDGVDDYVNLGNPSSLNITAEITLSVWVKIPSYNTGVFSDIITKGISFGGSNASYFISIINDGRISWEIVTDSNVRRQRIVSADNAAAYNGLWTNFTGTYDSSRLTLYINGILFSTALFDLSPIRVRTGDVTIGGTRYLDGKVSNVVIYNRALSAQEITQNYNATKTRFGL